MSGRGSDWRPALRLSGRIKSIENWPADELPDWLRGEIALAANLERRDTLRLSNFSAGYDDGHHRLTVAGEIGLGPSGWRPDLVMQAAGDSLARLLPAFAGREWLDQPYEARAGVDVADDGLHLGQMLLHQQTGGLELTARGSVQDLLGKPRTRLDLQVTGSALPRDLGIPDPWNTGLTVELLRIDGRARLDTAADALLQVDNLVIENDQLDAELNGDFRADGRLELRVDHRIQPTTALRESLPPWLQDTEIISGSFTVRREEMYWRLDGIEIQARGASQESSARGSLDLAKNTRPVFKGQVSWQVANLDAAPGASRWLPAENAVPVRLEGELEWSPGETRLTGFLADFGSSRVRGDLHWQNAPTAILEGQLTLDELKLRDLFGPPWEHPDFYFSREPFNDWWRRIDFALDLDLDAGAVLYKNYRFTGVHAQLGASADGFKVVTNDMSLGPGHVRLSLGRSTRNGGTQTDLRIEGRGLAAEWLNPKRESAKLIEQGGLNFDLTLNGEGNSWHNVLGSGEGQLLLEVENAAVNNRSLDYLGGDILSQVLRTVNPFTERETTMRLECAVIHYDFANGIATAPRRIALQTDRISFIGDSTVGLADESLQVKLFPRAREGLGISPSTLFNVVRFGGTLKKPEVEADPLSVFQSGAKVGAAFYTGGLSVLLQGLFNRFLPQR